MKLEEIVKQVASSIPYLSAHHWYKRDYRVHMEFRKIINGKLSFVRLSEDEAKIALTADPKSLINYYADKVNWEFYAMRQADTKEPPKTHVVNGVRCVAPIEEVPESEPGVPIVYFYIEKWPNSVAGGVPQVKLTVWEGFVQDQDRLAHGNIWLNADDAHDNLAAQQRGVKPYVV